MVLIHELFIVSGSKIYADNDEEKLIQEKKTLKM
jgi:hypothetical protein